MICTAPKLISRYIIFYSLPALNLCLSEDTFAGDPLILFWAFFVSFLMKELSSALSTTVRLLH